MCSRCDISWGRINFILCKKNVFLGLCVYIKCHVIETVKKVPAWRKIFNSCCNHKTLLPQFRMYQQKADFEVCCCSSIYCIGLDPYAIFPFVNIIWFH